MQTFLDTVHTGYVFYCNNKDLSKSEFWYKLIDIIQPLTARTKQPSAVIPHIYDTKKENWADFKNIQWNKPGLEKWADTENTERRFERVSVSFPSIKDCYGKKISPDIYLKISRKATEKEMRYEFVFMLIIKNEILENFEDEKLTALLKKLASFLQPVFIVKNERPWAIKESEYQYGDALHDFFPSAILANENEFIIRDGYEDWKPFAFN